jgi:hypothetical protein
MEHVVFFPASDGSPTFRRVPSLDEAVRLVEHLRNVEGLSTVGVHALTEVPLAFRAYYRVEVPGASLVPSAPAGVDTRSPAPAQPEPVPAPAVESAPAALVLVEDVYADEEPGAAQDAEPADDRADAHVLSAPASLGFFA